MTAAEGIDLSHWYPVNNWVVAEVERLRTERDALAAQLDAIRALAEDNDGCMECALSTAIFTATGGPQ